MNTLFRATMYKLIQCACLAILSGLMSAGAASAASSPTETITFYHLDTAGSPVMTSDQNGNIVGRQTYRPYGDKQRAANSSEHAGFIGKPFETDFGLSYLGARWYDPALGRFMGVDPKGFDEGNIHSFNRYAYGNNNPYRFIDPDGREPNAIENWWNASVSGFNSESWTDFGGRVLQGMPVEAGAVGAFGMIKNAAKTGQAVEGTEQTIYVLGRQADTAVAKDWAGHAILDIKNWTLAKNDEFIAEIIGERAPVYLGSPQTKETLWDVANNRMTVFARELMQLGEAGYKQVGDYMHPPTAP